MKIAVFVDIMDIFNSIKRNYSRHVDYKKYLEACLVEPDDIIVQANAYGSQFDQEAAGFIRCLKGIGFLTKYKKPKIIRVVKDAAGGPDKRIWRNNWEVGMTVDIIEMLDRVDRIILGSSDSIFVPLVKFVRSKGIQCVVFASGISRSLTSAANEVIEIDGSCLVDKDETTDKTE